MKAKTWLTFELRGTGRHQKLHITGARQTRPMNRLAIQVEIEIPEEVYAPKARLLVEHEEDIKLQISSSEEDIIYAATS